MLANNILSAINFLRVNNKLELIEKEMMAELYKKSFLTNNSTVNYFSGNNSLIIEFMKQYKSQEEIHSLLIINAQEFKNNKSLIISFNVKNEDRITMYKELLSQRYNLPIYTKNKINEFNKLLSSQSLSSFCNTNRSNGNKTNKNEIIKILVYIHFFEEYLITDLNQVFNMHPNCSLINSNWIQKYKQFYEYKNIKEYLKNNNNLNYNCLDGNISMI